MAEHLVLSNSKVKTWRRCPKQFEYKYIMGLKPKAKAIPLERGSFLHSLLEVHYDGFDWREKYQELADEFNGLFEEEREELGDIPGECKRIMTSYVKHYSKEDKSYKVIDSELDEIITLPSGIKFRMIVDLVVEEPDGGIWIWDHKTVGNFLPADFILLDSQLARYFWGMEYLGYKPLRGVMFNELITKPPTVPETLKNGTLTKRQNLASDVYTYYAEIKRQGLDPNDYLDVLKRLKANSDRWFRRTRLAKDKPLTDRLMDELVWSSHEIERAEATGEFPRSVNRDCQFMCSYLEPCAIELHGGDASHSFKLRYTTRDQRDD